MSKKIIVELSDGQYESLQSIPYGSIGSRIILDRVKNGVPFEDREKGEWIEKMGVYVCSCCGKRIEILCKPNFCANCGADMRGKADETDN